MLSACGAEGGGGRNTPGSIWGAGGSRGLAWWGDVGQEGEWRRRVCVGENSLISAPDQVTARVMRPNLPKLLFCPLNGWNRGCVPGIQSGSFLSLGQTEVSPCNSVTHELGVRIPVSQTGVGGQQLGEAEELPCRQPEGELGLSCPAGLSLSPPRAHVDPPPQAVGQGAANSLSEGPGTPGSWPSGVGHHHQAPCPGPRQPQAARQRMGVDGHRPGRPCLWGLRPQSHVTFKCHGMFF